MHLSLRPQFLRARAGLTPGWRASSRADLGAVHFVSPLSTRLRRWKDSSPARESTAQEGLRALIFLAGVVCKRCNHGLPYLCADFLAGLYSLRLLFPGGCRLQVLTPKASWTRNTVCGRSGQTGRGREPALGAAIIHRSPGGRLHGETAGPREEAERRKGGKPLTPAEDAGWEKKHGRRLRQRQEMLLVGGDDDDTFVVVGQKFFSVEDPLDPFLASASPFPPTTPRRCAASATSIAPRHRADHE